MYKNKQGLDECVRRLCQCVCVCVFCVRFVCMYKYFNIILLKV